MYIQLHDRFQTFLNQTIESSQTITQKKQTIKHHLLTHQNEYEQMLLSFFKDEQLTSDIYFYVTYTYQDLPIDMNKENEFVVSFLYDLENGMHYELVVFNEDRQHIETKEVFSRFTDFFS